MQVRAEALVGPRTHHVAAGLVEARRGGGKGREACGGTGEAGGVSEGKGHAPPSAASSPCALVSRRVRCADGLWPPGLSLEPDVLKLRGMLLASEDRRSKGPERMCVCVCVCVRVCV